MRGCRLAIVAIVLCAFALPTGIVRADAATEADQRINDLKAKISDAQNQENSLSKQIKLIDSNIELTTLRISSIHGAIEKLAIEITELANEIDRLDGLMTKRSELVLHRIPESYKRMATPSFGVLLLSSNVSDFVSRMKYVSRVQEEDAQLLLQLKLTQENFEERKGLREKKKTQQEELKVQQEEESRKLAIQKKEKEQLLEQTKSSEAVYQKLLMQAMAERQAIDAALVNSMKVGPVKKGDPIALVGNTGYPGCSTGAHLHFEVRKGGTWVNAENYIVSRDVRDDQNGGRGSIGSGSWDWPLSGDIEVTQRYGKTPWSWRYAYSGGIHTGIDMISGSSEVIRAPADGTLYSSSEACGGSSVIKIKYIEHGDGVVSFYLHVQ